MCSVVLDRILDPTIHSTTGVTKTVVCPVLSVGWINNYFCLYVKVLSARLGLSLDNIICKFPNGLRYFSTSFLSRYYAMFRLCVCQLCGSQQNGRKHVNRSV